MIFYYIYILQKGLYQLTNLFYARRPHCTRMCTLREIKFLSTPKMIDLHGKLVCVTQMFTCSSQAKSYKIKLLHARTSGWLSELAAFHRRRVLIAKSRRAHSHCVRCTKSCDYTLTFVHDPFLQFQPAER